MKKPREETVHFLEFGTLKNGILFFLVYLCGPNGKVVNNGLVTVVNKSTNNDSFVN